MTRLAAIWPAVLFALVAGYAGGLESAARFPNGWIGLAAVLATALAGVGALADPWRLGGGRWLLSALLVTVMASAAVSELPRAGRVGLVLLPAFLLLPSATARLVRGEAARGLAVTAWAAAVAAIAAWSLVELLRSGGARATAPLGHPGLLAVSLATSLPIAAVGWRRRGTSRALAVAALVLGVAALAATRSQLGLLALGAAAAVAARRAGRARELMLGVALLGLGLAVPRLEALVRQHEPASAALWDDVRGAWAGARERPLLGWGPGTTPWTLAGFLAPRPGAESRGELAGGPHSLPATVAFELGFPALALALALAYHVARARARAHLEDPALAFAGRAGLAAGAVGLLGGTWLAVPATAATLLLVAGFALAGERDEPRERRRWTSLAAAAYATAACVALAPAFLAHRAYERARVARSPAKRAELLAEAVRRDPRFPLYRARASWGGTKVSGTVAGDWRELGRAAAAARGVAPPWLRAAALAFGAGERGPARQAAARAMAFDPLSGEAPFLLHLAFGRDVDCAARAFLGEPKLAAATLWLGRERARRQAIERVARWEGADDVWRREFLRQALDATPKRGRPVVHLVTRVDAQPATASSLLLFRRSPWSAEVTRFALDRDAARRIRVPRASELAGSLGSAFPARRCAPR